jgi:hypothetical protein
MLVALLNFLRSGDVVTWGIAGELRGFEKRTFSRGSFSARVAYRGSISVMSVRVSIFIFAHVVLILSVLAIMRAAL